MRCLRSVTIVEVKQIDEETYLVNDGIREYEISKEEFEKEFVVI
jgi:hypothetical protein